VLHLRKMCALGLEAILIGQIVELVVDSIGSHPIDAALDGDRLLGGAGIFQGGPLLA